MLSYSNIKELVILYCITIFQRCQSSVIKIIVVIIILPSSTFIFYQYYHHHSCHYHHHHCHCHHQYYDISSPLSSAAASSSSILPVCYICIVLAHDTWPEISLHWHSTVLPGWEIDCWKHKLLFLHLISSGLSIILLLTAAAGNTYTWWVRLIFLRVLYMSFSSVYSSSSSWPSSS